MGILRDVWNSYRDYRASQMRHRVKLAIFWEEIGKVRRGEAQSLPNALYRQELYDRVDAMSTDEMLDYDLFAL